MADVLPDTAIDPGTNLLISGPPMTGKRGIALDVLAAGSDDGQGAIVVTTKDSADTLLEDYGELVGGLDGLAVGVVDCVTKQQGAGDVSDTERVKYAASPVDMTGIGIKLSEFLEEFHTRGVAENRILFHSLSTLLMYSDLQTVFRFIHVFTGRVQTADALGVYVIDSTAHDDQTMNTLKQLFDGVIAVEEGEAGEGSSIEVSGLAGRTSQ